MKKLAILAIVAMIMLGCKEDSGWCNDIPSTEFEQHEYTVSREGGELIIPINATHISNITIVHSPEYEWEVDDKTGDMTPVEGWCKLVKVIDNYKTRALPINRSALVVEIEPNDSEVTRRAHIIANINGVEDTTLIIQKE